MEGLGRLTVSVGKGSEGSAPVVKLESPVAKVLVASGHSPEPGRACGMWWMLSFQRPGWWSSGSG